MKHALNVVLAVTTALAGCASPIPPESVCTVTAPNTLPGEQSAAQQVAVDLTAFAKLPVKVDFKNDLKNKFDYTFQKVSDGNARCQMLTQLAACYKDKADARSEVLGLISSTNACGG